MSASDAVPPPNRLYRVAAVSGALLATFLLLGASGHFAAIWSRLVGPEAASMDRFALILPGAVLLLSGFANLATLYGLWRSGRTSLILALAVNVAAAGYFTYLLTRGVPDHPIGSFLAFAAGHTVVLASLCAGLRWPATAPDGA
ncbi:MAG: hypothetical protein AAFU65_11145 [Pseudomonadota bacterium]